ncbi:MAG TPA: SDR family oxidoreductase [Burkholderiales bacterium]|nr:SDR family oxidoreductase [Burkholderiales bacterium]
MVDPAVVTGAASGIGRECCRQLVAEGWTVFAIDRALPQLEALASELGAGARLQTLGCDVSDERAVGQAFASIAARTSRIGALICSAGVLRMGPLMQMAVADFDALFSVNTRGPWLCSRAALPLLKAAARPNAPARIVMVSSIAAVRPKIGGGAYAASKAALSRLASVMAVELAADNVLVNAVAPSTVDTPMIEQAVRAGGGTTYKPSGTSPLGRIAVPADIVAVIRFLLAPGSNYVTGTVIPVDGGTSAAYVPPR